jgi:hypothetical protein
MLKLAKPFKKLFFVTALVFKSNSTGPQPACNTWYWGHSLGDCVFCCTLTRIHAPDTRTHSHR